MVPRSALRQPARELIRAVGAAGTLSATGHKCLSRVAVRWGLSVRSCFGWWTYNKQLERTVMRHRVRAASASLHSALAARFKRRRAAAQLRR